MTTLTEFLHLMVDHLPVGPDAKQRLHSEADRATNNNMPETGKEDTGDAA